MFHHLILTAKKMSFIVLAFIVTAAAFAGDLPNKVNAVNAKIQSVREILQARAAALPVEQASRLLRKSERDLTKAENHLNSGDPKGALKHVQEAEKRLAKAEEEVQK